MKGDWKSGSESEINNEMAAEVLEAVALQMGIYYRALVNQNLPSELAQKLVLQWHKKAIGANDR